MPAQVPYLGMPPVAGFLGMTLFFVLSGFVIHYNYGGSIGTQKGGAVYSFAVARFARLYPLFLLAVIATIVLPTQTSPALGESWLFYVTMTHDWTPRLVSDTYVGALFAPGSWSISAEVFLYIAYVPLAFLFHRRLKSEIVILWLLGLLITVVSLFYVGWIIGWWLPSFDFTPPSFDHWLYYRSPFCRLSEFMLGVLIAALYNVRSAIPVTRRERVVAELAACVGAIWAVALLLGGAVPGLYEATLKLQVSWGLAPSAGAVIYYLARCKSVLSHVAENRFVVALGEASYSIYMLQWIFIGFFGSGGHILANGLLVPKIVVVWLMTVLLSLGCYHYFELPARRFIRRMLAIDQVRGFLLRKDGPIFESWVSRQTASRPPSP
jgi:peptidoglycan/LPS O-acetylase OafA/YrhL